jgi:hypothetical protein
MAAGSTGMTLGDLKAKCNELQANDQLKPFKAVVSCKKSTTEWRPAATAPGTTEEIANSGTIGASFTVKGFQVPFKSEAIDVPGQSIGCQTLEQIKKSVAAVDIELSCADLNAVTTIAALCGPAIDARVTADPSIVTEAPTGQVFDTCSGTGTGTGTGTTTGTTASNK